MATPPGPATTGPPPTTITAEAVPTSMVAMLQRYRDFRFLVLGTAGTQTSQWVLNIALGWLMLELTDSAFWVGLIGFVGGVPMLVASVPAGILLDRFNRRSVLLACQALLTMLGVGLTVLIWAGASAPWQLLAAAFLNGAFMAVNNAARQTVVPAVVPRQSLAAGVGLVSAAQNVSRILGPSLAGVLIGITSAAGAFAFQAVVLVVTMFLTSALSHEIGEIAGPRGVTPRLGDGFDYLRENPSVRALILLSAIPMFFIFPYMQLMPVFARDILKIGADGLGVLMAVSGIGAVSGGLLTSSAARIRRTGLVVAGGTLIYSLVVLVFAGSTTIWITGLAIMSGSFIGSVTQSLNNTLILMNIEERVRGRVTGIYMLTFGLFPLGGLPMGIMGDLWGAPAAVAIGAVISAIGTAILILRAPEILRFTIEQT